MQAKKVEREHETPAGPATICWWIEEGKVCAIQIETYAGLYSVCEIKNKVTPHDKLDWVNVRELLMCLWNKPKNISWAKMIGTEMEVHRSIMIEVLKLYWIQVNPDGTLEVFGPGWRPL